MQFGEPNHFGLFGILPGLVLFYIFTFQKRRAALEKFAGPLLMPKLLVGVSPFKQTLKATLLVLSLFFMILALCEPKWGFHIEEIKRRGVDLVIALDVSKSMLAEDLKPSRLDRAKLEIGTLLDSLRGDRVGLVAFAGSAFIQCPLTLDYATARLFLEDMSVESIPRGGTDVGGAIKKSIEAFEGEETGDRVVLLLTDGEDHGNSLDKALEEAKQKEIKLYPVGIGKTEGTPIPIQGEGGQVQYLRDREGGVVLSRLDPGLLQRIAGSTGGMGGVIGSGDFSLEDLYEKSISKLEKGELGSAQKKEYHHRFQWPLAAGLILLYLEGLLSERK